MAISRLQYYPLKKADNQGSVQNIVPLYIPDAKQSNPKSAKYT